MVLEPEAPAGGCLPSSPIPPHHQLCPVPSPANLHDFFSVAALGITFSDSVSCCVKKLLSELLKGKSPSLNFYPQLLADELVIT